MSGNQGGEVKWDMKRKSNEAGKERTEDSSKI